MENILTKKELRHYIRTQKKSFSFDQLHYWSNEIMEILFSNESIKKARTILLYASLEDEVDTHPFIHKYFKEKQLLLPVVNKDYLQIHLYEDEIKLGAFNIEEPTGPIFNDYDRIDLVIVPGMAFDKKMHRIGRGKGYYDKLLPSIKAPKYGICFDFQFFEHIPSEVHDVKMDAVFTGTGCHK
jgi:5-formyltetrahydrofolate cyclo-ligase